MKLSKHQRQHRVTQLIEQQPITSQAQLVDLLAAVGVEATQATVSRDLDRLGAIRVRRGGHMVYAVPAEETPIDPMDRLREALTLVRTFEPSGMLLVLRTAPGNAMPVARAFDVAELAEVAGCVSGDDTIFVAAREPATGADLAALVRRVLGGEHITV